MRKDRDLRFGKLKIALNAIPLWVPGAMTIYPVTVIGGNFLDAFRVNWIAHSFIYSGIAVFVFGIKGWLQLGLKQRGKPK